MRLVEHVLDQEMLRRARYALQEEEADQQSERTLADGSGGEGVAKKAELPSPVIADGGDVTAEGNG